MVALWRNDVDWLLCDTLGFVPFLVVSKPASRKLGEMELGARI